ncbi:MAG: OmpH family outer membrane protein [Thermoanaerobaculia bacterium]
MKRIALSILAAGVTAIAAAQGATAPAAPSAGAVTGGGFSGPVAIINSQRLALESAPGKEAYGRLKKLSDQKKEELDKVEKDARDLVQKLNDQGQSMPADKREALEKQADDRQKAWKRMQEDAQKDLQEAERKEMGSLEGRIGPIVKDFFKEKRYAVVLDSRAGIIYADEATDVTDEVLKRINTTVALPKPAGATGAAAPKSPAGATGAPSSKPPAGTAPARPTPAPAAKKQ